MCKGNAKEIKRIDSGMVEPASVLTPCSKKLLSRYRRQTTGTAVSYVDDKLGQRVACGPKMSLRVTEDCVPYCDVYKQGGFAAVHASVRTP